MRLYLKHDKPQYLFSEFEAKQTSINLVTAFKLLFAHPVLFT